MVNPPTNTKECPSRCTIFTLPLYGDGGDWVRGISAFLHFWRANFREHTTALGVGQLYLNLPTPRMWHTVALLFWLHVESTHFILNTLGSCSCLELCMNEYSIAIRQGMDTIMGMETGMNFSKVHQIIHSFLCKQGNKFRPMWTPLQD